MDDPMISPSEFFDWLTNEHGEPQIETTQEIPWEDLVKVVQLVLIILGEFSVTAEDLARQIRSMSKGSTPIPNARAKKRSLWPWGSGTR